jgi:hypothetical protein
MTTQERERLLTGTELALILALVLPIFLFFGGPIWTHSFALDGAIGWSYAPIPILVALALLRRRVLSFAGLLVGTITAVSAKYLLTLSVAIALWTAFGPPSRLEISAPAPAHSTRASPPRAEVTIALAADEARSTAVETGAPIAFTSSDRSLHTVRGTREGRVIFHHPVLPGRTSRTVVPRTAGRIDLSCAVHPQEHFGSLAIF